MKRYDLTTISWGWSSPIKTIGEIENGNYVHYEDIKDFIESVKIYVKDYGQYGDACITILQDALRELEK